MLFDYFRNGVMNALLQGRSFTFPSNLYFALLTTTAGGNAYMAGLIGLGAIGAGSQPPTFPAGTIVFELGSRDP